MININITAFILLCIMATLGFIGIIGVAIKMIQENKHQAKIKKTYKLEPVDAFGVSIAVSQLFTYENICKQQTTELCKKCDTLAKKYGCIGVRAKENDAIYLFLVENSQIAYYNEVKQLVKAKLLKEPIKAERVVE